MNNNGVLFSISILSIVAVFIVSGSFSAASFLVFTLFFGSSVILLTCKDKQDFSFVMRVYLIAFSVIAIETLLQWLGNDANMTTFADDDNDQYKFWTASLRGVSVSSPFILFKECIIDNIYYENGGYYYYIQLIAYISSHYFDGNHLMTQMLGSSVFGMLSSVFVFYLLRNYLTKEKAYKYSLVYVLLTPMLPDCLMIHRDPIISFFYLILIYLWLCKRFGILNFAFQIAIILVLINFRLQHGLFAITFLMLSILGQKSRTKWVYIGVFAAMFVLYGIAFADYIMMTVADTFIYYDNFTNEQLDVINSGLGRYVYMLPSPVKEIAQVFFLQLQFPSWDGIIKATNFYEGVIGFHKFIIKILWFYVFSFIIVSIIKKGFKKIPSHLIIAGIISLAFLFLNSSHLDLRRVICMYPIIFIIYVYYKEYVCSYKMTKSFIMNYSIFYSTLCLVYFVLSGSFG